MGTPAVQAVCDERLAHTMTWARYRGGLFATIVVKATVALHHGRTASLLPPRAVVWCDKERPSGELEVADEAVPFSGGGAVLVRGFLYADVLGSTGLALGRVVVRSGATPLVDKVIGADRTGRIPLEWGLALKTHENPIGTLDPVLVDPREPTRAAGTGPVAPGWAPRVHFVSAPIRVVGQVFELPELDPRHFNPAPHGLQCRPLQGDEEIVLVNLTPKQRDLRCSLPAMTVSASVSIDGAPVRASFFLDMLTIDAEALTASAVWRAAMPVPPAASLLAFQATLAGNFLPPPVEIEPAPATVPIPEIAAPAAAPPPPPPPTRRAARVSSPAPPDRLRFDDPRAALIERLSTGRPTDDLDLEGADLSGLDLSMRSFGRCKLDGANLTGTDLRGASLWASSLVGATLERAFLDDADLEDTDLTKAKAQKASFVRATLARAKIEKARMDGALLDEADLSDCLGTGVGLMQAKMRRVNARRARLDRALLVDADLSHATLDFATLAQSSLDEANFEGASLADADLTQCAAEGARFVDARFARAKLIRARLTSTMSSRADFTGAALEGADLSRARLDGALFDHAQARGALFVGATLSSASMNGTVLAGANLTSAGLDGTDLSRADVTGARGV
jgi:uncharacterized protein YjbI with pentapeptide repeats